MSDYFEIDFCDFGSEKSSDAIAIRYSVNGQTSIHVVDGGFQEIMSSDVRNFVEAILSS